MNAARSIANYWVEAPITQYRIPSERCDFHTRGQTDWGRFVMFYDGKSV